MGTAVRRANEHDRFATGAIARGIVLAHPLVINNSQSCDTQLSDTEFVAASHAIAPTMIRLTRAEFALNDP